MAFDIAKLKKGKNKDPSPKIERESLDKIINNDLTLDAVQKKLQNWKVDFDKLKLET